MRSVFVSQLSQRVGDRELAQFFESQAGKVREAKVITDRVSRRSKGCVDAACNGSRSCGWLMHSCPQCRLCRVPGTGERPQGSWVEWDQTSWTSGHGSVHRSRKEPSGASEWRKWHLHVRHNELAKALGVPDR